MTKVPRLWGANRKAGFTVLELLIATIVFSVVLLLVTAGILQIARVYYKGVTEATTQNAARNIIDTISQAIQFSGGDVTTTPASPTAGTDYAFCVGNEQFTFRLGWQVENTHAPSVHKTWHALVQYSMSSGGSSCSSATGAQNLSNQSVDGRDLMGQHMRLSDLQVTNLGGNLYRVKVKVVYGDDDLLDNPTATNAVCKGVRAGSQFCSVSELSTIVVKRVE